MSKLRALKHLLSSAAGPLAIVFDTRFGTDTVTAAATGWFTFGLHPGSRQVWCNASMADDTGDALTAATAKKTIDAAYAVFIGAGFSPGDQLMIAGTGGRTYTNSAASTLADKGGVSATYPTAILSYDPADPTNVSKYGRLTDANKPIILGGFSGFNILNNGGAGENFLAIQGMNFNGGDVDGGGSVTIQGAPGHSDVVLQNNTFNNVQLTIQGGVTYDATGATYMQRGNISKNAFFGAWASGGNIQGIFIHAAQDWWIQDNVFGHCGWRIGSSRDDIATNGGANAVNHGDYVSAVNSRIRLDRNLYFNTSADGLNLRGPGIATGNASIDEPIAGNIGGFSGSIAEAPTGVSIQVDDWLIMGAADISSSQPRGQGPWTTNTIAGSHIRNVAAFDSPKFGVSSDDFTVAYNNGNSADISSITHSGTTATLTTVQAHGLTTGAHISVDHAVPTDYNRVDVPVTVTGANTLTYATATTPATNATSVGVYTAQVPQFMLFDKIHSFNFARTLDAGQSSFDVLNAINNTWTNSITDQLAPGAGNQVASSALFPNYKTKDQVITAVLTGIGLTPAATAYGRMAQLANAALARPDLPWAGWLIGVGFPAMGLTPTYATPAYSTFTDTPTVVYPTALGALTLSTLNFTHGVSGSAILSGVSALPVLTCSDLPSGLSISGRVISGTPAAAGTPTIHVVETSQDGSETHTTAFTLNIA